MKYEILAQGAVSTLDMVCKCTAIMITVTDTGAHKHTKISIDIQGQLMEDDLGWCCEDPGIWKMLSNYCNANLEQSLLCIMGSPC
jgi:hypothetical protein